MTSRAPCSPSSTSTSAAAERRATRRGGQRLGRVPAREAEHLGHPLRLDPEGANVAGAGRRGHRDLHQLRLLPGREDGRPDRARQQAQPASDGPERHVRQRTVAAPRRQRKPDHVLVGQHLGPGHLEPPRPARRPFAQHVIGGGGDVLRPDRLITRTAAARDGHHRKQRHAAQERQPRVSRGVDDRGREHGRVERRLDHGLFSKRLRAKEPRPRARRRPDRAEEEEALGSRGLCIAQQAGRREPVELLDAAGRLVADRRSQVDHLARAADELPQRCRVGQVPERDLDPHAVRSQASRVPHEHAHGLSLGEQTPEQRRPDHPRRACQDDHRGVTAIVANASWTLVIM